MMADKSTREYRKAVEIAVAAGGDIYPDVVYVVDNTGTVWKFSDGMEDWEALPLLPPLPVSF